MALCALFDFSHPFYLSGLGFAVQAQQPGLVVSH